MATKVIIIGDETKSKKKVPIEINFYLTVNGKIDQAILYPSVFNYIELISKGYSKTFDLMFGYDNPECRSKGVLLLGKWNDGVV